MQSIPTGTQEWDDAFERSQQLEGYIRDLHKAKESTDAKKQLVDIIEAQADLWDGINWPSAAHFWPSIEITTTDSEGRFKFVVPKSYVDSDLTLFAKAERQLSDDEKENWYTMGNVTLNGRKTAEFYWWMVDVHLNGKKIADYILSNDNMDSSGVWGWFDGKPLKDYMINYTVAMDAAKIGSDNQDWEENLEERENLPPPQTPERIKADLAGTENTTPPTQMYEMKQDEAKELAAADELVENQKIAATKAEQAKLYAAQARAVLWLQTQATNGDASAQCCLGLHYLNGQGCETNLVKAIYWLQKAAAQGDLEASNKLASLRK